MTTHERQTAESVTSPQLQSNKFETQIPAMKSYWKGRETASFIKIQPVKCFSLIYPPS